MGSWGRTVRVCSVLSPSPRPSSTWPATRLRKLPYPLRERLHLLKQQKVRPHHHPRRSPSSSSTGTGRRQGSTTTSSTTARTTTVEWSDTLIQGLRFPDVWPSQNVACALP